MSLLSKSLTPTVTTDMNAPRIGLPSPDKDTQPASSLLNKQLELATRRSQQLLEQNQQLQLMLRQNEQLHQKLWAWLTVGIASGQLPQTVIPAISEIFNLQGCAICVWGDGIHADWFSFGQTVSDSLKVFANSLVAPYTGNKNNLYVERWLPESSQSIAIVPLYNPNKVVENTLATEEDQTKIQGLLVMGATLPAQFTDQMDTQFIEQVALLLSAMIFQKQNQQDIPPRTSLW